MERPPDTPNVDDLVVELKARVEQREREGLYPSELTQELHEHFRRIVAQRSTPDLHDLRKQVEHPDLLATFSPDRISLASGVPGGSRFHALVARTVARQTHGVLEQMQQFADAVRDVLAAVVAALEDPHNHVHADLVGQIDALFEHVASFERGPVGSKAAVADLRRRVEQLEEEERRRRFRPFFSSDDFEASFRGTREELLERYRGLAARLRDSSPVVDLGCGRGEFLELLVAQGVDAFGVDVDPDLVEDCKGRGLDVRHGDALSALEATADESLGGIVLIQVIEHLTPQEALDLVALSYRKLRQGGLLVIETVNPQSLYVFAHAFYVDPTHTHPVHPAYLAFVVQQAGFGGVEIDWRSEPPEGDVLDELAEDDATSKVMNENVRRLNTLLFAPQDYALIAVR